MGAQAKLLERVAARLAEDPVHVAPVLRLIADPDAVPRAGEVSAEARVLNAQRIAAAQAEFVAHALRGDEVRALLGGISRQALHQKVRAGRLLALHRANASWFPRWQFTEAGAPVSVLPDLLDALPADPLAADAVMRAPLPEERGRSAADLLAAGQVARAVHYARTAGGDR